MKIMEDVFLDDSIEIQAAPEDVFSFINGLVDDASYRAWHPTDHVTMRWEQGEPWQEGSIVYAEEYLHGELHKLRFTVTNVVANQRIDYMPTSRFMRRYVPRLTFAAEPADHGCVFHATAHYRLPLLPRLLAKKKMEHGLACVRQHMKEEGENLKKILEAAA